MKRIVAIILMLCLVPVFPFTAGASPIQHEYSTYANSGVRHEVCTTLSGTNADHYYTGNFTSEKLSSMSGDPLLKALRSLMTDTHAYTATFSVCRDLAVRTDCENADATTISLLYTGFTATEADWITTNYDGWLREHVWCQYLGSFATGGPGADLHHVRAADQFVKNQRGNLKFGYSPNGTAAYASITENLVGGTYDSNYFEPNDNVKGDVARIVLYMYVRYGGDSDYTCDSVTNIFESVSVLLEWCAMDPVDTWEMGRNEVVAAIQGNRNVFIDYPELAWLLFGRSIPSNMATPSGGDAPSSCSHKNTSAYGSINPTCTADGYSGDICCDGCGKILQTGQMLSATGHANQNGDLSCDGCGIEVSCGHGKTTLKNAKDPTCTAKGYSGDTYCAYCDQLLDKGSSLSAHSHSEEVVNAVSATCTENGYSGDTVCSICSKTISSGQTIYAIGSHSYGDWIVLQDATATEDGSQERTCILCGETETLSIPATGESLPAASSTVQTQTSIPGESNPGDGNEPNPSDSRILIIAIVLAACAAGLICFFVLNKRPKPVSEETES